MDTSAVVSIQTKEFGMICNLQRLFAPSFVALILTVGSTLCASERDLRESFLKEYVAASKRLESVGEKMQCELILDFGSGNTERDRIYSRPGSILVERIVLKPDQNGDCLLYTSPSPRD